MWAYGAESTFSTGTNDLGSCGFLLVARSPFFQELFRAICPSVKPRVGVATACCVIVSLLDIKAGRISPISAWALRVIRHGPAGVRGWEGMSPEIALFKSRY